MPHTPVAAPLQEAIIPAAGANATAKPKRRIFDFGERKTPKDFLPEVLGVLFLVSLMSHYCLGVWRSSPKCYPAIHVDIDGITGRFHSVPVFPGVVQHQHLLWAARERVDCCRVGCRILSG